MQTLTIKINDNNNVEFLIQLLKKFNFVAEIQTSKKRSNSFDDAHIIWATGKPSISDFAGIWEKSPKHSNRYTIKHGKETCNV